MSEMVRQAVLADTLTFLRRVSKQPIGATGETVAVADLGLDSIQVLELVADLEDHFNISIPLNQLPQLKTVGQLVDKILQLKEPSS